jgi:23S rRNA (adenine2503-C2)-methyltransferase
LKRFLKKLRLKWNLNNALGNRLETPLYIYNYTQNQLKMMFKQWDLPAYTSKQVFSWIYQKQVMDFNQMTNLAQKTQSFLKEKFTFNCAELHAKQISEDGTVKYLWKIPSSLSDTSSEVIESVLIPMGYKKKAISRYTACVSTQAGCKIKCKFCATGIPRFAQNLSTAEIIMQILEMQRDSQIHFSNVVVMGMGEPLDNYEATYQAMKILNDTDGINLGRKRITISSSGLLEPLKRFIHDDWPTSLAISLHSANTVIRNSLIPIARTNSLEQLKKIIRKYTFVRRLPVTFEYILLKNINDQIQDAEQLAEYCRDLLCKINLIRYNPVPSLPFESSDETQIQKFKAVLKSKGLPVFIRERKGLDISAACGQLGLKKLIPNSPTTALPSIT